MINTDQTYWTNRALATFPKVWGADTAFKPGGTFYAYVYSTVGLTLSYIAKQISYTQLQTRIATATDQNLEAIATDYFGFGIFPRNLILDAAHYALNPETDAAYSQRIRDNIFALKNTLAAIQLVVSTYVNSQYISETILNTIILGLDTAGGLDTRGGLDGRSNTIPQIPSIYVFDIQSDPKMAAKLPLASGQFCILFSYGGLRQLGFFVGRSFLNRHDYLINSAIQIIRPLTSSLNAYVNATKADGTFPIYADNRVG